MSILFPSNNVIGDKMTTLVEMCLKSCMFAASGQYTIEDMEQNGSDSGDLSSPESCCRKHALRATEDSVSECQFS